MINGYEETYKMLVPRLKCDLEERAERLGLTPLGHGKVSVDFLGRAYMVTNNGVEAADNEPSSPQFRGVVICYVSSNGSGSPTGNYSLLHRFAGATMSSGSGMMWMTQKAVDAFKGDYKKFSEAATRLGMTLDISNDSPNVGEYVWAYNVLPKIPMHVIFNEADDEFPCEIKIMFDDIVSRYLEFEQLAFLSGCFISALCAIHQVIPQTNSQLRRMID